MEKRLLEPKEAAFGAEFFKCYTRTKLDDENPLTKQFTKDIIHNYTLIAREVYKYDHYSALPTDSKAFIGRCAATKKKFPRWSVEQVINHELNHINMQAERLWREVKELAEEYYQKCVWPTQVLPVIVDEWYIWAEKNPTLAYVD